MRKRDLANELAIRSGVSHGEAADRLDRVINEILQKLRAGQPANCPGFGQFDRMADGRIRFTRKSDA